jgi:hypothetical protein
MAKTLTISDETYELIKEQLGKSTAFEVNELDEFIGKKVFIRTVTYHLVGRVVKRIGQLFELQEASWVADSGRFMQAIKEGTLDEVEPVGQCWVNIEALVDMYPWKHNLPKEQS